MVFLCQAPGSLVGNSVLPLNETVITKLVARGMHLHTAL